MKSTHSASIEEMQRSRAKLSGRVASLRDRLKGTRGTLTQLHERLNKLEWELELGPAHTGPNGVPTSLAEGFDTLEIDHFSQLQEISRNALTLAGRLTVEQREMEGCLREAEQALRCLDRSSGRMDAQQPDACRRASVPVLMVRDRGTDFGFRTEGLPDVRCVVVSAAELKQIEASGVYTDGESYHVTRLGEYLGAHGATHPAGRTLSFLVLVDADVKAAIVVDNLLGKRDVVLEPLCPSIVGNPVVLGGAIPADGKAVIVLDLKALLSRAIHSNSARPEDSQSLTNREPPLVLVVDDSNMVRKLTTRSLSRMGLRATTANDGIDALEVLGHTMPDVMLLDIEMPRMNGFELAETLRSHEDLKHLPVIMISSRSGKKHVRQAKALGVDHFLGKPYKDHELQSAIEKVLGSASSTNL